MSADAELAALHLQLAERDAELESIKNHLLHAWTLECSHCGGVAAASWDGRFYEDEDNDGEGCLTCGLPGRVGVDGDAYWQEADEGTCKDETCTTCNQEGKAP